MNLLISSLPEEFKMSRTLKSLRCYLPQFHGGNNSMGLGIMDAYIHRRFVTEEEL